MQKFFKSGNAKFWLFLGVFALMVLLWKTGEAINGRLAALPVKSAPKHENTTPPLDQATFYAVWVKRITAAPVTQEDPASMDTLFKIKEEPKTQLESLKLVEPDYVEIFKKAATVQGVSDTGVYINGRFYQVGEHLQELAMVDSNGKPVVPTLASIKDGHATFMIRKAKVLFSLGTK